MQHANKKNVYLILMAVIRLVKAYSLKSSSRGASNFWQRGVRGARGGGDSHLNKNQQFANKIKTNPIPKYLTTLYKNIIMKACCIGA